MKVSSINLISECLKCAISQSRFLKYHFLHLIQTHNVRSPVIELGCPRALMRSHLLGFLQVSPIGQVNRNPRRPEGVTADLGPNPRLTGSPTDHVEGILPIQETLPQNPRNTTFFTFSKLTTSDRWP
jgi:hypothetical protein